MLNDGSDISQQKQFYVNLYVTTMSAP